MSDRYEPVIGLEIHVQLATETKMFCADVAEYGADPNTHVCPVCMGLPGALPVINRKAVELAVRAATALGCDIHETSIFARKNYFYPDLPKGYQISQFDRPLATGGYLEVPVPDASGAEDGSSSSSSSSSKGAPGGRVRIHRIHLEEDAGKSMHDRLPGKTAVDLNRAGVPLIEIVTEPDLVSPAHARAFLTRLKQVLEYLEVSDCDMEKGSLRVDANLSVRPRGTETLGTKTEVKNMNSFGNVERALKYEAERQSKLLAEGGSVEHETLTWDAGSDTAKTMRSKEESHDYRYFPEPDLPPLVVDSAMLGLIRDELPELPDARERRFREDYGLPEYDAGVLTASRAVADYFEEAAEAAGDPKAASNWVMTEVMAWRNEHDAPIDAFPMTPRRLAGLIKLQADGTISSSIAKDVFARMLETGKPAAEIVEAEGLAQVSDEGQLEQWVDEVIAENPDEAERFRAGEQKLMGFFMGQIMRRSGGKADPKKVGGVLRDRLG